MNGRRKKNTRFRGSKTHGWGSMKKNRGAGHRGGRGNAGSGKRGDAKKPTTWKQRPGKFGFKRPGDNHMQGISIKDLEAKVANHKKENDVIIVDLNKLGYQKLLGQGKASLKLQITADAASAKAIEKVQTAGGSVILPPGPVEEPQEEAA